MLTDCSTCKHVKIEREDLDEELSIEQNVCAVQPDYIPVWDLLNPALPFCTKFILDCPSFEAKSKQA